MLVYRLHQLASSDKTAFRRFWRHTIKTGETNHQQQKRERNLPPQTNKKESGKLGLQISSRQCLKCCRGAANNLREVNFCCSFIEMTRFWHFYWNLLKRFQQTALKVQFGPFYLNGVTFWNQHAQNHLPEILKYFSQKRLKYRRRKNLEHYLKTTKSETNMI